MKKTAIILGIIGGIAYGMSGTSQDADVAQVTETVSVTPSAPSTPPTTIYTCIGDGYEKVFTVDQSKITKLVIKEDGYGETVHDDPESNWSYIGNGTFKHSAFGRTETCTAGTSGKTYADVPVPLLTKGETITRCRDLIEADFIVRKFHALDTGSDVNDYGVRFVRQGFTVQTIVGDVKMYAMCSLPRGSSTVKLISTNRK